MSSVQQNPTLLFLLRSLLMVPGVLVAAYLVSGIQYEGTGALVFAVLLLSLLNASLKPLLMLLSLPFIILTFGLGILLINAVLLALVGFLIPGFSVESFSTALLGALLISVTGFFVNTLVGQAAGTSSRRGRVHVSVNRGGEVPRSGHPNHPQKQKPGRIKDDDDVIDI